MMNERDEKKNQLMKKEIGLIDLRQTVNLVEQVEHSNTHTQRAKLKER